LKHDLGCDVRSEADVEVDVPWQHNHTADLKKLSNDQLKSICKSHGKPFSNKKQDQLGETVLIKPTINQSIAEIEKLKSSFLQPLPLEDCSAHKSGSSMKRGHAM
jgi:hypothetical protein